MYILCIYKNTRPLRDQDAFRVGREQEAGEPRKAPHRFSGCQTDFDGPVFERMESRHGEDRIFAIGLMEDIEIVVVYVMRGKRRRIISARRAHRNEREEYTRRLKGAVEGQD